MSKFKKLLKKKTTEPSTRELLDKSAALLKKPIPRSTTNSAIRDLSNKEGSTALSLVEDLFAIEEDDPFADIFSIEEPKVNLAHRKLDVTIEYDPSKLSGVSELLMECIACRGAVSDDFNMDMAISIVRNLGQMAAQILIADEDRWQQFIFAAEYVRLNGTKENWRDAALHPTGKVNMQWDASAENVEQDGRTLGGVDLDPFEGPTLAVVGDAGIAHTVRDRVMQKEKERLEINRPEAAPAPTRVPDDNHMDSIWELASRWAKKPRAEWEGQVDWMLEQRIKYCYDWLHEMGTIDTSLDIFWPVVLGDNQSKDSVVRRHDITLKVIEFWRKSLSVNGEGLNLHSESYRKVLAAMKLQSAIEVYTTAGTKFNLQNEIQDKEEEILVKRAAKTYFQAHFPIAALGAGPGPLSTMDPNYVEYVRLCRQYKISLGTLLHEAKL